METHTRRKIKEKGFTLIELMVSLTVFSIVMLISVGTLLTLIDANAKAQALYMATTNLSFALDAITRDIRTGHQYNCYNQGPGAGGDLPANEDNTSDCVSGKDSLSFLRDWDNTRVRYRLYNGKVEQKVETGNWTPMTSNAVVITDFVFLVKNSSDLPDKNQPTIDVMIEGYVDNGLETTTDFNVQTHIVSRRLDVL